MNAVYKHYKDDEIIDFTAKKLTEGKVIGWFQDRMEFGPRALEIDQFLQTHLFQICKKS